MKYPLTMTRINRFCAYISGSIVIGVSGLAVMESVLRKFFASPTTWSLNFTSGIFIWACFLGGAWAFQELGHVSVDMVRDLVEKLSKTRDTALRMTRRVMSLIGYGISFIVVYVLLYGGWRLCVRAITLDQLAPYNFKFPLIISYSAIVVGTVLMLITVVLIILDLLKGGEKYL